MKQMKKLFIVMTLALLIGLVGNLCAEEEEVMETDLSDLPEIVLAAAEGAKEDIVITGYRQENELGQLIYEVQGLVDEMCYEIEVTENGQVLDIEECD